MLVATLRTLGSNETVLESTTAKIRIELVANVPGQRPALLFETGKERLGRVFHGTVEHRLLGAMAPVARRARPRACLHELR